MDNIKQSFWQGPLMHKEHVWKAWTDSENYQMVGNKNILAVLLK
jgi:hypothetical protein